MGPMQAIALVAASRVRRRWAGLVLLGLLAGVVGGAATGALAGISRTEGAADRLIADTGMPAARITLDERDPAAESAGAARLDRLIRSQPGVRRVWPYARFIGRTTGTKDWYSPMAGRTPLSDAYRPVVVEGRMPAADSAQEVAISVQTAANSGLHVGARVPMDLYTAAQMREIDRNSEVPPGAAHLELRVVGIVRDPADVALGAPERVMFGSPAMAVLRGVDLPRAAGWLVDLSDGAEGVARLRRALVAGSDPGAVRVTGTRDAVVAAGDAVSVLRAGLLLLAGIVTLVGLFALAQGVRRHLGRDVDEDASLAGLGFTRRDRVVAASLTGAVTAATALVVAVGVAVAVSPLFPIGRPRVVEPAPGFDADVVLLAAGGLFTAVAAVAVFSIVAFAALRRRPVPPRRPESAALASALAAAPAPVGLGTRLALEPGRRRAGVSARSAIVGTAVGVAGLVAALTFSGSLERLVTTPALYGLDYDLSMEVPAAEAVARAQELARDDGIAAVATLEASYVELDGSAVEAVSVLPTKGDIEPTVRDGRLPVGNDEIALGPVVAERLGVGVGGEVRIGSGDAARRLQVVGVALDPRAATPDYGGAALVRSPTLAQFAASPPYPLLVTRYRAGVDVAAKTAELDRRFPYGVMDESLPATPGRLQSLGDVHPVPDALAWFFGGLVLVALGNGMVSAGRRHRRTLGIVRGLGFTGGQVRASVAAMGVTMALCGVLVGIPLGVVIGSSAWTRVSDGADLEAVVVWPVPAALVLVPAVVGVAALWSWWPAHVAVSRRPSEVLRAE